MKETFRDVLERLEWLSRMFQREYTLIDDGVDWTPRQLLANAPAELLDSPAELELDHADETIPGSITVTQGTLLVPDAVISGEMSGVHFTSDGVQVESTLVYVVTWKERRQTSTTINKSQTS